MPSIFTMNSHWLLKTLVFALIGFCNYYGFSYTTEAEMSSIWKVLKVATIQLRSRDTTWVEAFTSHHCDPGLILKPSLAYGWTKMFILVSFKFLSFGPSRKKQTLIIGELYRSKLIDFCYTLPVCDFSPFLSSVGAAFKCSNTPGGNSGFSSLSSLPIFASSSDMSMLSSTRVSCFPLS